MFSKDADRGEEEKTGEQSQQQPQPEQTSVQSRTFYGSWDDHNIGAHTGARPRIDVMLVPTDKVGMIIGRGGIKINELQAVSGARISIDRNSSEDGNTKVNLLGSQKAKNSAKRLIKKTISENNDSRPGKYQNNRPNNQDDYSQFNYSASYTSYSRNENNTEEINWQKLYEESEKSKWESLTPILKNVYIEDPAVAEMTEKEVADWRLNNNDIHIMQINKEGKEIFDFKIPNPAQTFEQCFKTYPEISEELKKQGFTQPSPIQSQAWPILLSGKDLVAIAQTGTGKTLFILPALIHIEHQIIPVEDREGPNVLIVTPTIELAIQIENEVKKYNYRGIKSICIYGEADPQDQVNEMFQGMQIVISTPERLNDLVNEKQINIKRITYLVLDEADRMLAMGYGSQIKLPLINVRPDIQIVMTSETCPQMLQCLAKKFMFDPVFIAAGTLDLAAVNTVTHKFTFTESGSKYHLLLQFLKEMDPKDKLIVFCTTNTAAIDICADLAVANYNNVHCVCEGFGQEEKECALEGMRTGTTNFLIVTDGGILGTNIEGVTHIINVDLPQNIEIYNDRVGRTGKKGIIITYMNRNDLCSASGLVNILKEANQDVPEMLHNMAKRFDKWTLKQQMKESRQGLY